MEQSKVCRFLVLLTFLKKKKGCFEMLFIFSFTITALTSTPWAHGQNYQKMSKWLELSKRPVAPEIIKTVEICGNDQYY